MCENRVAATEFVYRMRKLILTSARPLNVCRRNARENPVSDDRVKHLPFYFFRMFPLDLNPDDRRSGFFTSGLSVLYCMHHAATIEVNLCLAPGLSTNHHLAEFTL